MLRCSFCSFACTHGSKLRLHMEQHTQPTHISCPFCPFHLPYCAPNKYRFRDHLYLHLDEDLKCTSCSYTHRNFLLFLRHVRTHQNNFVCDTCAYSSRKKELFVDHVKRHEARKRVTSDPCLECPSCGTKSKTHRGTLKHLQEHLLKKEYVCHVCSKDMPNARSFKRHMLNRHLL
ncbi:Zinc finger C2H2-type, partial [Trinorchestia longiramus]